MPLQLTWATSRSEIRGRPFQVRVECDQPALLAAKAFALHDTVGARLDGSTVIVESRDAIALARMVGELAAAGTLVVEGIDVSDENVQAVYDYLIRPEAS